MVHNVDLRRRQMWGVYSHIASPHTSFRRDVNAIDTLEARDLLHVALAAGECRSIREALRKKNVDTKVKSVLRTMKLALRNVPGSEGEREYLWMKLCGLRIWNGCSMVFFTLNPHDIWSPLLVVFANGET